MHKVLQDCIENEVEMIQVGNEPTDEIFDTVIRSKIIFLKRWVYELIGYKLQCHPQTTTFHLATRSMVSTTLRHYMISW